MRKSLYLFSLAAIASLALVASDFDVAPTVTNLGYEVTADSAGKDGAGIKLFWDFPEGWNPNAGGGSGCYGGEGDTSYFLIYADGKELGTTDTNFFYVYTPAKTVEVVAVYSNDESSPEVLDFSVVETSSIEIWTANDPDPNHPSGFGFSASGAAASYPIVGPDKDKIDYYLDLGQSNLPAFTAPSLDSLNDEDNSTSTESGTYSNLAIVSPPGLYYSTSTSILEGGVYGFWLNDAGVYDSSDHFGKVSAQSVTIEGTSGGKYIYKVTLALSFQPAPGLRWVVTP